MASALLQLCLEKEEIMVMALHEGDDRFDMTSLISVWQDSPGVPVTLVVETLTGELSVQSGWLGT